MTDSLEMKRGYTSDQHEIWREIDDLSQRTGVFSDTGAMKDIYESKNVELSEIFNAIPLLSKQKGILIAINGEITGFDIVSLDMAYKFIHHKLLKSYALHTLQENDKKIKLVSPEDTEKFIKKTGQSRINKYKSTGLGWDFRFKGESLLGSALYFDREIIHMAFFTSRIVDEENFSYKSGTFSPRKFSL